MPVISKKNNYYIKTKKIKEGVKKIFFNIFTIKYKVLLKTVESVSIKNDGVVMLVGIPGIG